VFYSFPNIHLTLTWISKLHLPQLALKIDLCAAPQVDLDRDHQRWIRMRSGQAAWHLPQGEMREYYHSKEPFSLSKQKEMFLIQLREDGNYRLQ
jgi:hypothetical protein